jgi:hypothetical protein
MSTQRGEKEEKREVSVDESQCQEYVNVVGNPLVQWGVQTECKLLAVRGFHKCI